MSQYWRRSSASCDTKRTTTVGKRHEIAFQVLLDVIQQTEYFLKISECYLTQFSWIVKTKVWSFVYMIDGLCTFPVRKLILAQYFFFPDQVVVWIYSVPTVELRDPINRTANPCLNDLQILWLNHRWASRQHKSLSSSIQLLSSYTDFLIFQIWCNTLTQADVFVFISQVLCCNFGFLQIHLLLLSY